MTWARDGGYVVLTGDLDFSALLATSSATGPSVVQVRTQDVFPESLGAHVIRVLLELLPIRRLPGSEGPG